MLHIDISYSGSEKRFALVGENLDYRLRRVTGLAMFASPPMDQVVSVYMTDTVAVAINQRFIIRKKLTVSIWLN